MRRGDQLRGGSATECSARWSSRRSEQWERAIGIAIGGRAAVSSRTHATRPDRRPLAIHWSRFERAAIRSERIGSLREESSARPLRRPSFILNTRDTRFLAALRTEWHADRHSSVARVPPTDRSPTLMVSVTLRGLHNSETAL